MLSAACTKVNQTLSIFITLETISQLENECNHIFSTAEWAMLLTFLKVMRRYFRVKNCLIQSGGQRRHLRGHPNSYLHPLLPHWHSPVSTLPHAARGTFEVRVKTEWWIPKFIEFKFPEFNKSWHTVTPSLAASEFGETVLTVIVPSPSWLLDYASIALGIKTFLK